VTGNGAEKAKRELLLELCEKKCGGQRASEMGGHKKKKTWVFSVIVFVWSGGVRVGCWVGYWVVWYYCFSKCV